jgi:hypothetical protein
MKEVKKVKLEKVLDVFLSMEGQQKTNLNFVLGCVKWETITLPFKTKPDSHKDSDWMKARPKR